MTPDIARLRSEWFGNVRGDVLAGIVVALALIPEAIAFSIIAGVDPKVGLYASFVIAVTISIVGGRPGMISAATGGEGAGPGRVLEVYSNVGWLAVGVGILMMLVAPLIRRLMHLDTLKDDEPSLAGQDAIGEPAAAGVRIDEERRP